MSSNLLTPPDIGMPYIFPEYRDAQLQAIEFILQSPARFIGVCLPTGSGKTLTGQSVAALFGCKTVTLTTTKGLADQYISDFGEHFDAAQSAANSVTRRLLGPKRPTGCEHLVDIRGLNNYDCLDYPNLSCDDGQKLNCSVSGSAECTHGAERLQAILSQRIVTNYSYWMNTNRGGSRGLEPSSLESKLPIPVGALILDEAHTAPQALSDFLAISITEKELIAIEALLPVPYEIPPSDRRESLSEWKSAATVNVMVMKIAFQTIQANIKAGVIKPVPRVMEGARRLYSMLQRMMVLSAIKGTADDDWVCEEHTNSRYGTSWTFDPISPGRYAESRLFCGVPKVVLMSATNKKKTLHLLGIKDSDMDFREWPRVFPKHRSPVYHIPTASIGLKTTEAGLRKWVETIDEIIAGRLDRKGIIHTVSYDRQDYLYQHSKYAKYFLGNKDDPNSPKAQKVVVDFKNAPPPALLVSPSFSTGWDFPGRECEYQIVAKIAFPNTKSKVMKARIALDKGYIAYLAIQDLVQACGRGMRFPLDRCETFVVDDNVKWLVRSTYLLPQGFEVKSMGRIPAPPPRLLAA